MKTQQEVEKMKDGIQEHIEYMHKRALQESSHQDAEKWWDSKRQLMAQYNILLEVLK